MLNEDDKSLNTAGTEEPGVRLSEAEVVRLFEDGDRALISANAAELRRIYAEDYVQYDEGGVVSTKRDLIASLVSGRLRFLSMVSTGRSVTFIHDEVAIVHGTEEDEIERGGQRLHVAYAYMDAVVRRGGVWQIAASQLVVKS